MEERKAQNIGSKQALVFAFIGLIIAQSIMTYLSSLDSNFIEGFFWFKNFHYKINIIIGAIILLTTAFFFGKKAGVDILIKGKNYVIIGIKTGIIILFLTAFFSSCTGLIQEGTMKYESIEDYIYKPMFWILIFGIIPVLVVGTIFGYSIKRKKN